MSDYMLVPPTPSTGSEASLSPQYQTLYPYQSNNVEIMFHESMQNLPYLQDEQQQCKFNGPHLVILEQPVEKFRFRYKSEMSGTHGSLMSASAEKNRKAIFPTVKLENFSGEAIIRCSLYSYSKDRPEHSRRPHPHRLVLKNDAKEEVDPHDAVVSPSTDMTHVFKGMGIIHTARKHIQDELRIKAEKLVLEEIHRREGHLRKLTMKETADIKLKIQDEERSVNLNAVCLRFAAFTRTEPNGPLHEVCNPVFSKPIFNLKSAMTGDLRISRLDHCTSPASGMKEIFLLVEKVAKKNIKVQFFELDEESRVIWSADAKFNESDVHHQYAIVITTPPYRDPNIQVETKNVYVKLLRPSDGETSEPRPFSYLPVRGNGRKRARASDYSSSSSIEFPEHIRRLQANPPNNEATLSAELSKAHISSEEFLQFMQDDCMKEMLGNPFLTQDQVVDNKIKSPTLQLFKESLHSLNAFIATKKDGIHKMIRHMMGQKHKEGNSLLHLCFLHHETPCAKELRQLLLAQIVKYKLFDLLHVTNNDDETIMHIAIKNGSTLTQLNELPLEHMKLDFSSDIYPLHMAVEYNYGIDDLCSRLKEKDILLKKTNEEKLTPLQLAVKHDKLDAVKLLIQHGSNINDYDRCTGYNILHQAIANENMEMIEYIIKTPINKIHSDFDGKTCLQLAGERLSYDKMQIVCNMLKSVGEEKLLTSIVPKVEYKESDSESDDDMEVVVKSEPMDNEAHDQKVEDPPVQFVKELAKIQVEPATLNALYMDLNFGYMLGINANNRSNPFEFLIHLALTNGVHINEIRHAFKQHSLHEAVRLIDKFLSKK